MRKYIRHPSDIPIQFNVKKVKLAKHRMRNISVGGVSIRTEGRIEIGSVIDLTINSVTPAFTASGRVAGCLKRGDSYDVGIQFLEPEDAFRVRMVEQICHIEQYKKDMFEREGRQLSGEEAALEWINKFASDFPGIESNANNL